MVILLQGMLSELAPSVLKKQEEEKLKTMWKQIDVDGNGKLDEGELRKIMVLMGKDETRLDTGAFPYNP